MDKVVVSDSVGFKIDRPKPSPKKNGDSVRLRLTINGKNATVTVRKGVEESISLGTQTIGVKFLR